MGTTWRGMLAPIDTPTGDGRRFLGSGISNRALPLALKWQRSDEGGHQTSIAVGSLETINIGTVAEAVDAGWIPETNAAGLDPEMSAVWGGGQFFDDLDPEKYGRLLDDVNEAKLLTAKGIFGPSVDAGAAEAVYVRKGSDTPLTMDEMDEMFMEEMETGEPSELELLFTTYEIAAATLVSIPAFAECQAFYLDEVVDISLTAAVKSSGWSDFPLADRDLEWDESAAEKRIADDAGIGTDNEDWQRYAEAFLYHADDADPNLKGTYGFQIVDVVDDERRIVPRAVITVAGVLQGSMGGTKIPETDQQAMKDVVASIYERMADEFDDDSITAPWDDAACNPKKKSGSAAAETSAAVVESITAAAEIKAYELSAFAPPATPDAGLVRVTVTADGRVFGHIATHDVCHIGIPGMCMTAPVDMSAFDRFHRYHLAGIDGEPIAVGRITYGAGQHTRSCDCCRGNDDHACAKLSMGGAISHHDQLATVAWVRAWEDHANNAIRVAGVLADGVTVDQVEALARGRVSGDWRSVGGELALVEILTLSRERPGFPLPRARMASGQMMSLTAAGTVRQQAPATVDDGIDYERLAATIVTALTDAGMTIPTAQMINTGTVETDENVNEANRIVAELSATFGDHDRHEAGRLIASLERTGDVLR